MTQGLFPASPPAVLGHEFSGVIAGAGVSPERVGEMVACDISSYCLECVECRDGRWSRCVKARKASGAFAEYAVVPADCALPVPNPRGSRLAADLYDLHYREIAIRGPFGRGSALAWTLACCRREACRR